VDSELDISGGTSLAEIDGRSMITYSRCGTDTFWRVKYALSSTSTGTSAGDWVEMAELNMHRKCDNWTNRALVEVNGNPAMAYSATAPPWPLEYAYYIQ
jgi:hypothetical protein